jgi:predicted nucleic acid-binding protein
VKKLRVYLDNCCFNRPYDNQNELIIHLETEAKIFVQDLILKKQLELVWSFVMDYENNDNPYEERKNNIREWKSVAVVDCDLCDDVAKKAKELMTLGLRQKDASHIACAIQSKADYFLTTDKKILNKAIFDIVLINPVEFVRRYFDE